MFPCVSSCFVVLEDTQKLPAQPFCLRAISAWAGRKCRKVLTSACLAVELQAAPSGSAWKKVSLYVNRQRPLDLISVQASRKS